MESTPLYVPILRAKAGEIAALERLSERAKYRSVPVLDIPEPSEEGRASLEEHLAKTCKELARSWGTAHPLYLDIARYPLASEGEPTDLTLRHLFTCARQARLLAVPVAGPVWFRGEKYLRAASSVGAQDGRGIALRLPLDDFIEPSRMMPTIRQCLELLDLAPSYVDLLLDFEAIPRHPPLLGEKTALVNIASSAIRAIAEQDFRRIVLCGSSIPESLGTTKAPARLEFERRELAAWRRITSDRPTRPLAFGDYAVIFPFQTKPPTSVRVPAKIRIATPEKQILLRARGKDYRVLSQEAVATQAFQDLPASWGAHEVRECAGSYREPSNPTEWVARDTNMHIEATVVHIEDHLQRVAPTTLGPPVELQGPAWLQRSLPLVGPGEDQVQPIQRDLSERE